MYIIRNLHAGNAYYDNFLNLGIPVGWKGLGLVFHQPSLVMGVRQQIVVKSAQTGGWLFSLVMVGMVRTGCYKIWEIGLLIISTGWIQT